MMQNKDDTKIKSWESKIKLDDLLDIVSCDYIVKDRFGDVLIDLDSNNNVGKELVSSIRWNKHEQCLEIRIDKDLTEGHYD